MLQICFYTHLFVTLYFVCIVCFSISDDRPFIASDKCTQKYAHCIVLCNLRTSGLYNEIYGRGQFVKEVDICKGKQVTLLTWLYISCCYGHAVKIIHTPIPFLWPWCDVCMMKIPTDHVGDMSP